MRKLVGFLALIILIPVYSYATKNPGQSGLRFLDIGMGARAFAMAEAFTALGKGSSAMFYNIAGISNMDSDIDISCSFTNWIVDIKHNALGVTIDPVKLGILKNFKGCFGFSVFYTDYGTLEGTEIDFSDPKGYIDTEFDCGALAVGLSYALPLNSRFKMGCQFKYVSQNLGSARYEEGESLDKKNVSGFAFDFGTIYYTGFKDLRIGVSIRNCTLNEKNEFKYEDTSVKLPLKFSVGTSMNLLSFQRWLNNEINIFNVELNNVIHRDNPERVHMHIGAELILYNTLALRGGYKCNYDEEGLSFGTGLDIPYGAFRFKIDYAYSILGVFEDLQRFSFEISF